MWSTSVEWGNPSEVRRSKQSPMQVSRHRHSPCVAYLGYVSIPKRVPILGSISRLLVNELPVDLGAATKTPTEVTLTLSSNECHPNPCQNHGECVPAHEHEGFRCDCFPEFEGVLCQYRTKRCANGGTILYMLSHSIVVIAEECESGVCVDEDWGSNRCMCPLGRRGEHCELHSREEAEIPYKYNGKSSFLALPAPNTTKQFRVSLLNEPTLW